MTFGALAQAVTSARPPTVRAATVTPPDTVDRTPRAVPTPLSTFTLDVGVSRDTAMRVPAVAQARNLVCGVTASLTLLQVDTAGRPTPDQPSWLSRPDPRSTLYDLLSWTVDHLLFHGRAAWAVTARGWDGYPVAFELLDPARVNVDSRGANHTPLGGATLRIDGQPVDPSTVVLIPGPDEGLLRTGTRTLQTAYLIEEAVRRFARFDAPATAIIDESGVPLTDDEVDQVLTDYLSARAAGMPAYLSQARVETATWSARELQLVEARQAVAADVARLVQLPPRYVNAPSGDSMTYANAVEQRNDLVDLCMRRWWVPIEQALSGARPRGQAVRLDASGFLRANLTDRLAAWTAGVQLGAITPEQAAVLEPLWPDPATDTPGGGL